MRLDEFTKEEWFDVGGRCNPDLTWDQFERMWAEFLIARQRKRLS